MFPIKDAFSFPFNNINVLLTIFGLLIVPLVLIIFIEFVSVPVALLLGVLTFITYLPYLGYLLEIQHALLNKKDVPAWDVGGSIIGGLHILLAALCIGVVAVFGFVLLTLICLVVIIIGWIAWPAVMVGWLLFVYIMGIEFAKNKTIASVFQFRYIYEQWKKNIWYLLLVYLIMFGLAIATTLVTLPIAFTPEVLPVVIAGGVLQGVVVCYITLVQAKLVANAYQ